MRLGERALACVGAVIGAGFASGREVVVFFSRYGEWSWGLILLGALAMSALCALTMRASQRARDGNWCALYPGRLEGGLAKGCLLLLYGATGGGMLSAAGELVALLVPIRMAYPLGVLGTALLAWVLHRGSLRPLAGVSFALALLLLCCCGLVMKLEGEEALRVSPTPSLPRGAGGVLTYAAMNVAVALGVVCECAGRSSRDARRAAVLFGLVMTGLLCCGNALYLRHPELDAAPLPIVRLLGALGRPGYALGAATLYLAVFTTLIAILRALRALFEPMARLPAPARSALPLLLTGGFSLLGFERIVEKCYAPVGLCCLALLFAPLCWRAFKNVRTNSTSA